MTDHEHAKVCAEYREDGECSCPTDTEHAPTDERRDRYAAAIQRKGTDGIALNSILPELYKAADAAMAVADAEQRVKLGEQADKHMASLRKVADAVEQQECRCSSGSPEDFDGPAADCPQHGNPQTLGYCPLEQYEAWRSENERLRERARKAERAVGHLTDRYRGHEKTIARIREYAESRCTAEHADLASASWILHLIEDPTLKPVEEQP